MVKKISRPTSPATDSDQDCLPAPDALALVRRCGSPEADGLPLTTPLGQIFTPGRREQFCQCVADGVPTQRAGIPCGASNTLQDVVEAISC